MAHKRKAKSKVVAQRDDPRSAALAAARMVYDAARRDWQRSKRPTPATDATAEVLGATARVRNVVRDLCRNNARAARGRDVIVHNTVGVGFNPTVRARAAGKKAKAQELVNSHLGSTLCDAGGQLDYYAQMRLVMATVVESGEAFILRRWGGGGPLGFTLRVLEPDYLDTAIDGDLAGGGYAISGIEFDAAGRRVRYHFFDRHPGYPGAHGFESHAYDAADVAHVYRVDRPGQVRGISWLSPVVLKLKDLQEFLGAELIRQKISACFAIFVEDSDVGAQVNLAGTAVTDAGTPLEAVEPGIIERLRPGEKATVATPPVTAALNDYVALTDREIAAGLGISYEAFTGDYSRVNYSSARAGWLEFSRSIDSWQQHMLMPMLCASVGRWIIDGLAVALGSTAGISIDWTPPIREMVNPTEEIKAAREQVRAGFASRASVIRRYGEDPETVDAEIAADHQREQSLGLVFDSNATVQVTGSGNAVPHPQSETGNGA